MPNFSFSGWTAADLGMGSLFDLFNGGPFVVAGTPDTITISDGAGDGSFDDAPGQPTPDPGSDQQTVGDLILDGAVVVPNGGNVWNIGEFTVTNATTGEVGTLVVFGDSANNPIGAASTISLSVGDSLTFTNFVINGAEPYAGLVCFAAGTKIETKHGAVCVEKLSVGDQIKTLDRGLQEIRWIGRRHLTRRELFENPKFLPVRILAGALGKGLPKSDLVVSRQHRMLATSKIAERMFGTAEVLVSAIKLTKLPGIYVDKHVKNIEYFHLLFDQHEIIFAEGSPTESLFTGPEAMKSISLEAQEEILAIFPEITKLDYSPKSARFIPLDKLQKKLIARHLKNSHSIRMY